MKRITHFTNGTDDRRSRGANKNWFDSEEELDMDAKSLQLSEKTLVTAKDEEEGGGLSRAPSAAHVIHVTRQVVVETSPR